AAGRGQAGALALACRLGLGLGLAGGGGASRSPAQSAAAPSATSESPTGFSVVVPACDRARILSDVVTRLASSSYPEDRYEVLVVDDGSSEDLSPIFAEMPDNVRLLPRAGDATFRAGQARQRGADAARFDHLVFLDADVAAPPDLLWHHDWVHRHAERDTLLLGYLSGYNLHDLGHLHTPDAVIGADLDALPILPDRSREPTLRACLDNLDLIDEPWGLTYTGHMSLPRRALARVGGFATEFEGWGLEDVDLGIRLHRGGVRFAFSRFAVGYHVVDPSEPASRNPFRADAPSRDRFAGYLTNLDRLAERHAGDAPVEDYVARSRHDIDETCGRPGTVGIELGGAASVRSTHHAVLHRLQPGGVPTMELLDRVAYAKKVRAKTIYLLGGAVAEHPGFLEVVRAAADVCGWVSMQTLVYPFAAEGLAARAEEAGLRGVVALVESLDPEVHERLHGVGTFARFGAGLDALERTRLERSAHLALSAASWASLARTRETLTSRGWRIAEVTILDPALWTPAREHPLLRDLPISAPEAP
ncbi:MAG: glycosyltransferase, partial [Sandaracinaceae bacterium]